MRRHRTRVGRLEPEVTLSNQLVRLLLASSFPTLPLASAHVTYLAEGEDFTVFTVEKWAFRFPKRSEVAGWLVRERALLNDINPRLSLTVPQFTLWGNSSELFPFPFVGYHLLPGIAGNQMED